MTGIQKAIAAAGSEAKLADMLGVTQQAVNKMKKRGYVPLSRVDQITSAFRVDRAELIDPALQEALK